MTAYPVRNQLFSLLTLSLIGTPVLADEGLYLSEQDFLTDIPEITAATRAPQKLTESPASISVIDSEMIAASGARNIPDLLRLVPGFQTAHVSANKFATTYHGVSDNFPRRLEVMVDGRSVYVPMLGAVDWTSLGLNLDDIARIEVIRGSNVPTQGANAFMGSVNIITREPAAENGGYVTLGKGSLDSRTLTASHTDSLANWSYRLSAGHEQNDDTDIYHDRLRRNYLSFSGSYTPSLTETLRVQAGIDRGMSNVGQADELEDAYVRRQHESHYQYLRYQNLYSDTGTLQISVFHNYLNLETPLISQAVLSDMLGSEFGYQPDEEFVRQFQALNKTRLDVEHGETHTYDAEIQLTESLGQVSLVSGLGYRREQARSDTLFQSGAENEQRWRGFGNLNWTLLPKWQLNSGLMYEYSSENVDAFSYRHALIHHPSSQSSLRLGYSLSERLPSLQERLGNYALYAPPIPGLTNEIRLLDQMASANPDLQPERNRTYEIGYYRNLPVHSAYVDVRVFREEMDSMVDSYFVRADDELLGPGRTIIKDNRYSWTNQGAELRFKHQPIPEFWYLINYAYINTRHDTWVNNKKLNGSFVSFGEALTPEHTASLMLNWRPHPALNLSAMHYYMDSVNWLEGGIRDSYQRTDLRVAQSWQLDSRNQLEAALTVQNAFGPTYAEFYEHNLFDRRYWLQLSLRYR